MCSVFGILGPQGRLRGEPAALRERALAQSRLMRHRGPDWSGIWTGPGAVLAHERLAIVDPDTGSQPLVNREGDRVLAVNGEIYNHRELRSELDYPFLTGSDCEVILALYDREGPDFFHRLNGIFAFVLHDARTGRSLVARDPVGVMPLYIGTDPEGNLCVASELKALVGVCETLADFPPGHVLDSEIGTPRAYRVPAWRDFEAVASTPFREDELHAALSAAVRRQLMTDVPWGVLLSGGLDSSLIAALAVKHAASRVETDGREPAWWPRVHSFAIGLGGSPDLAAAEKTAEAIGTVHHTLTFTEQQGLDALEEVIYHLETYDVTTVRASIPMYLMARRIKAHGIKMVLSGEGSDELFGGYLYFHRAPNPRELHEETVRKLDRLHQYDCLRANKSLAAWGVEGRVPFLDREFVDVAMSFDPGVKMCRDAAGAPRVEKWALRHAFRGLLPESILWRQKEQFSDGVGYGWIDRLRSEAERRVSHDDLASAAERFEVNPPLTKEAYWYREIFERSFPHRDAAATVPGGRSIACSTEAALAWESSFRDLADPSGRAVRGVHGDSY